MFGGHFLEVSEISEYFQNIFIPIRWHYKSMDNNIYTMQHAHIVAIAISSILSMVEVFKTCRDTICPFIKVDDIR